MTSGCHARSWLLRLLPVLLAVFSSVQVSAQATSAGSLAPGDAIRITVWRKEELSGEFDIAADSTIAHPLYRTVKAVGVPTSVLEARVRERLLNFEGNPEFVIVPLLRVAVGGEVRLPGLYTLRPEVTLLQAVARAGGMTERGRLDRVKLVRNGSVTTVNLSDPVGGQVDQAIQSGDQLYVERRRDILREYVAPSASIVAALAGLVRILN